MRASLLLATVLCAVASAQSPAPDRLLAALKDRAMADQVSRMTTDERVSLYEALARYQPDDTHYRNLLATAFIQKMRETTDYGYLDRAARIIEGVLAAEASNYEALRLRSEIELERHNFAKVAEYSRELTQAAPMDPWNWGTLGDALMELGKYDEAAGAYQHMVSLRPDLSSYNRAAYYRFVAGDVDGAIEIMKRAIDAGGPSGENTAWCLVELGHWYFKTGKLKEAERAYTSALRAFPSYHPAYAGLGRLQAAQGNRKEAIASYQRAQASVPFIDYAAALHDLYEQAGLKDEARKQAELIDAVDKLGQAAKEKTNRNLALIYADEDRNLARALELAQAEFSSRQDIYTCDVLAWTLYKNKKYAEAEKTIGQALQMGTPEPMFYYHAAMIAQALGKKTEAKAYLDRMNSLNSKFDFRQAPVAAKMLEEVHL